MTDDCLPLEAL